MSAFQVGDAKHGITLQNHWTKKAVNFE